MKSRSKVEMSIGSKAEREGGGRDGNSAWHIVVAQEINLIKTTFWQIYWISLLYQAPIENECKRVDEVFAT